MDSAVAAAWARKEGYGLITLAVDYGQRHGIELAASEALSSALGAEEHLRIAVDLRAVGGSALTSDEPVPKGGGGSESSIPPTYVPARNTLFLALALGLAEVRDANAIVIGANSVDYSGYPDCRPEFLEAFERLGSVATRAGLAGKAPRILAPLLDLSKSEIVKEGKRLEVPFGMTFSCYDPPSDNEHCGECDACLLRKRGFGEAGVSDPTRYRR